MMSDRVIECPAFVDTHSHDDLALLTDPGRLDKRNQGIGAQVIGNCGISPFPAMPDSCQPVKRLFDAVMGPQDAPFPSVKDYRRKIARDDIVILQGYNALRASMFGPEPRRLDAAERKKSGTPAELEDAYDVVEFFENFTRDFGGSIPEDLVERATKIESSLFNAPR